MGKYNELISDESLWLSATPTEAALSLPFHVTEAGHFLAQNGYTVKRDRHESFLMLYTLRGTGTIRSGETEFELAGQNACVIDCHIPHEYFCHDDWEFFWLHFDGASASAILDMLSPNGPHSVDMSRADGFSDIMPQIFSLIPNGDIESCLKLSGKVHSMLCMLTSAAIKTERGNAKSGVKRDIDSVIEYIAENYKDQIAVDDMIERIHISKYYFIRIFRRMMGVTPYSYLTNYRINRSKELLRSTSMSITDISEECGFLDPGNFIAQFKKRTGMRPLQYRRDFS